MQFLLLWFAAAALSGGSSCRSRPLVELIRIEQQYKIGYIDPAGRLVVPAVYDNGRDFSEGLAAVREGGYYGFIDVTGRMAIVPQFDWAEPFSEGLAAVHADGRFFYINHRGARAFRSPYTTISTFRHGVAMVETTGKHRGLIDRHGRLVLDTLYSVITDFDEGLAFVDQDTKDGAPIEGLIDTLGHFVIPVGKYATVGRPHHGYSLVSDTTDDQIVVDRTGREVLRQTEAHHSEISVDGFSEGIALVELYKYWEPEAKGVYYTGAKAYMGYVDLDHHTLLNDTLVEDAQSFSCGRAFIKMRDGYFRLIDRHMHRIGQDQYFQINSPGFVHDLAIVTLGGSQVVIDTTGRVVFRPSMDVNYQLSFLGGCYFAIEVQDGDTTHYGIYTLAGKVLYPPKLEQLDYAGFIHGGLRVVLAGRLAVLDSAGRVIWRDGSVEPAAPPPLHIDYMLRGYFEAYSSPDAHGRSVPSGGWGVSRNIPQKIDRPFEAGRLQLVIDTTIADTFFGAYRGYPVYLVNLTRDTCRFDAEDSRLYLSTEVQGRDGVWRDIDYLPNSWCGNSYHTIDLEPGAYWRFTMPAFDGAIPVNLRLRLERKRPRRAEKPIFLYSNVIRSRVNPAQFWNKRRYTPQGLMDPYNE